MSRKDQRTQSNVTFIHLGEVQCVLYTSTKLLTKFCFHESDEPLKIVLQTRERGLEGSRLSIELTSRLSFGQVVNYRGQNTGYPNNGVLF